MTDIKGKVLAALQTVEGAERIAFYYPKSFKILPCISYYEANNSPAAIADDEEYLSEIIYVVDIWAGTNDECTDLMLRVDVAMRSVEFLREFSSDVYDSNSDVRHKTSRYRYVGV